MSSARLAGRLVDAQDSERRKIERNLHDGAQQQLVALGVRLGVAPAARRRSGAGGRGEPGCKAALPDALDDLRDLARGHLPAATCRQGASRRARRAGSQVGGRDDVEADGIARYPTADRGDGLLLRARGATERGEVRGGVHGRRAARRARWPR